MSVVYRLSDRFDVEIGKMTVTLAPLNYKTKSDMQAAVMDGRPLDAAVLALKHSIKAVKGLKLADGSDYQVEMDGDTISEDTVNDILNIPEASTINLIALGLINGVPQGEFIDPQTNKPIEGVKFVKKKSSRKK